MKEKNSAKGVIMLLVAAAVWGSSFVAQAEGMELVEGFTFNGIRMLLGGFALLPIIAVKDAVNKRRPDFSPEAYKKELRRTLKSGLIIGVILCVASNFQQFAFNDTPPGKVAFITAFYMFLVPVFGLFLKKRPSPVVWVCVALGIVGLYLLCIGPEGLGGVGRGEILTFACAVFYAVHILCIENLGGGTDPMKLSCVQFLVTGVVSCVLMLIFESPDIAVIRSCAVPIAYSGIMSSALAFTLQIFGQRHTRPAVASLVMCTESVFGVLFSCLFYRSLPTAREAAGCCVMFAAIVLSQIPDLIRSHAKIKA